MQLINCDFFPNTKHHFLNFTVYELNVVQFIQVTMSIICMVMLSFLICLEWVSFYLYSLQLSAYNEIFWKTYFSQGGQARFTEIIVCYLKETAKLLRFFILITEYLFYFGQWCPLMHMIFKVTWKWYFFKMKLLSLIYVFWWVECE